MSSTSYQTGPVRGISRSTSILLILLILGLALTLRTVGIGQPISAAFHPVNSLAAGFRLTLAPLLGGESPLDNFFGQLFVFYRGVTAPLVLLIELKVLALLGARFSEFLLALPFVLIGVLGVFCLYALGRRWFGTRAGLLAALFLTLASWHVANSRTPQALVAVFLVQVLVFLTLDKLFETRRRIWALLASLALLLEVLSNNGFPFTIVAVLYFLRARGERSWQKTWHLLRQTRFLPLAAIPLVAILAQGLLFLLAIRRNELMGLLAWSNQHSRFFFDVGPSVIIHGEGQGIVTNMLGSLRNIGVGLNFFFAFFGLLGFIVYFRHLWQFNIKGFLVFWYLVLGVPQIIFFFTFPEIAATNIAIPILLLGSSLLSDLWQISRRKVVLQVAAGGLLAGVALEGFLASLHVNYSFSTPNRAWYFPAEAENGYGSGRGYRAIKSTAYFVRTQIPEEAKVHVNHHDLLSELYFDRQLCLCGGQGLKTLFRKDEDLRTPDIDYFVEYNPLLDGWGNLTDLNAYRAWKEKSVRGPEFPLIATIVDGDLVLAKIFSRRPAEPLRFDHGDLARRFGEEFYFPKIFAQNPRVGMTFWRE